MNLIRFGRVFAVVISVSTFVFLFLHDSWRDDNLFLVPDLILCALLLGAATLPVPYAAPALGFTLAMSTGVFTVSVSSYAVRGELGTASLLGTAACATVAALLHAHLLRHGPGKARRPGHRKGDHLSR
ncbi:hypothetical protein D0T12_34120 [Actinomadura spongiicola]|uniref:Uncharacterized protein n=1 Tax=Actinomadura spongiicola TaxID=2303421 RepID=A0A372G7B3_9ACTN|nr:hypothetical protein [Actinomadura spongiicola]RFS81039.1 hypothetical protein D0T12_34120 [Actinomadura spongiicola]